jgi:hypothetical protein
MNMFILDESPVKAAQLNCNTHCSKIILEVAQMLCTTYHLQGIQAPYKPCHQNHPVTKWIRGSYANFMWACVHGAALYEEKLYRTGKGHKSVDVIEWAITNSSKLAFPNWYRETFAIAISPESLCRKDPSFDESDPVKCYQLYYKYDKKDIAKWTKREIPEFML